VIPPSRSLRDASAWRETKTALFNQTDSPECLEAELVILLTAENPEVAGSNPALSICEYPGAETAQCGRHYRLIRSANSRNSASFKSDTAQ